MTKQEKEYLKKYDISKYERPSIAADIIPFAIMPITEEENFRKNQGRKLKLLLIKRAEFPYKDCWALPGGFVTPGETVEEAARRELKEETSVTNAAFILSGINADSNRDPRGWIISNSYIAILDGDRCKLRADSDAWEAAWFTVDLITKEKKCNVKNDSMKVIKEHKLVLQRDSRTEQNNLGIDEKLQLTAKLTEEISFENNHRESKIIINEGEKIAFDHTKIILEAIIKLRQWISHNSEVAFDFLPKEFTLNRLQNVFEQVLDTKLITANFRRKIAEYVEESENYSLNEGEGHRPAKLYKRKIEMWR